MADEAFEDSKAGWRQRGKGACSGSRDCWPALAALDRSQEIVVVVNAQQRRFHLAEHKLDGTGDVVNGVVH